MERIESINPQRILWCCADRGIAPGDFADAIGVARESMSRVLETGAGLTFNQLRRVAEFFGRGVLFFLEVGDAVEAQVHSPQFRTLASQKPEISASLKALIERVERQRDVYVALREDLDDPDLPIFSHPELPAANVKKAAEATRAWLDVGDVNDFDSYRAAIEAKGILVFRTNGYGGKWQIAKENPILGFAIYDRTCPVIVVKKQEWDAPQAFTLLHELAHLLLHKASSIDDQTDFYSAEGMERDANLFAGHVLVPDRLLNTIVSDARPAEASQFDEWLLQPRKAWGVSGEVILRRLLDAGRLPRSEYLAYRAWRAGLVFEEKSGGNRMYRHREPRHIFGDPFVRTVLEALNAHQITLAKASTYLDSLKIKDLHQLESFYAGA